MNTLKETFIKNGIDYRLLNRTDRYALFQLTTSDRLGTEIVGYEVCRLRFNKESDRFGKHFPASESLPSNEQFGMDGDVNTRSKTFFPADLSLAEEYLHQARL